MPAASDKFVHLHVHTVYSFMNSLIHISDLIQKIKLMGMEAVAITDHGNLHGAMAFYDAAVTQNIKPIIGCVFYVSGLNNDKSIKPEFSHLVLLAKNLIGWQNLCRLSTKANMNGSGESAYINMDMLKVHKDGLIALGGCLKGEIPSLVRMGNFEQASRMANFYHHFFGEGNFYLEVNKSGLKELGEVAPGMMEFSRCFSIPLVATNDCHYSNQDQAEAWRVLTTIKKQWQGDAEPYSEPDSNHLYLKSGPEMAALFTEIPEAITNTKVIADACDLKFHPKSYQIPVSTAIDQSSVEDTFEVDVRRDFVLFMTRLLMLRPGVDYDLYKKRLEDELIAIRRFKAERYFRVVCDYVQYARQNGIPVGPGRGSVVSSLVALCLGITEIDPIEHGLVFERFLSPAKTFPDIDVDFCIHGRRQVWQYLKARYGADRFAHIAYFPTLEGRKLGMSVNRILRNKEDKKQGRGLVNSSDGIRRGGIKGPDQAMIEEVDDILEQLKGLPAYAGINPAGVVISDEPLAEVVPLFSSRNGEITVQVPSKKGLKHFGLVRYNLLGLEGLTLIQMTLDAIQKKGVSPPDLNAIDLNHSGVYEMLCKGQTAGLSMFEDEGGRSFLVLIHPESFTDLMNVMALFRLKPMEEGLVDAFVNRKRAIKETRRMTGPMDNILRETYGTILYQEQVMQIACEVAGYDMAAAVEFSLLLLRLNPDIDKHREQFVGGSVKNGFNKKEASDIFQQVSKEAHLAFNKAHCVAYTLLLYRGAYLKALYGEEYKAAAKKISVLYY